MLPAILGQRAALPWTDRLISKLSKEDYRHAYVAEGVKTWIARQVRALREQRGWSQSDLSIKTDKPQSAISRIEDPDYGKMSLQTLFDLAKAFDVALVVKFIDYPTFLRETDGQKTGSMYVESFDEHSFASHAYPANKISITLLGVQHGSNLILLSSRETENTYSLTYFDPGTANQNYSSINYSSIFAAASAQAVGHG
jgi:transcriptional regulator with XRE-family HTH domain